MMDNSNLLAHLYDEIPEFFQQREPFFDDSPGVQMWQFMKFLCGELEAKSNQELIDRGFRFLNRIAEEGTEPVLDLLTTGVFMGLKDSRYSVCLEKTRQYLSPKAIGLLDSVRIPKKEP